MAKTLTIQCTAEVVGTKVLLHNPEYFTDGPLDIDLTEMDANGPGHIPTDGETVDVTMGEAEDGTVGITISPGTV